MQPNLLAVFLLCAIEEGVAYGKLRLTKYMRNYDPILGVAGVLFARSLNILRARTHNLALLASVLLLFVLATLVSPVMLQ